MNAWRSGLMVFAVGGCAVLSGCQSVSATCAAGLEPTFDLTVSVTTGPEPDIQYCAAGHCSPRPKPGPIPRVQRDTDDEHAATVTHVGRDEWRINPRSIGTTPTSATIRLFRDGILIGVRTVRLAWPHQDPCAASNPPNPHPTVAAG